MLTQLTPVVLLNMLTQLTPVVCNLSLSSAFCFCTIYNLFV
ncbi:hypothetical protein HanPSC8_Chr16g0707891 [Helianthus annuus]|nr:hypothetical protein HanPSC8_Chr16g0707891 [Helianthus annuus]